MILASPLTPLEHALRAVLDWLHLSIGLPWAWSVVALTVIVRMLLVPLTVKQIHSMQSLQRHAPQMKEIQKKYKHDRERLNQELMTFYKENKINPAASCLPLAAQMPVFFALYFVLRNFSKNPPKGSLSWLGIIPSIADHVTAHWSGYVLLFIYVVSQMASTYFMGATMDKTQRTILLVMPVAFVFFIAHFPTGLVLYWMTTNLWTVGQGLVTRTLIPKKEVAAPKRTSRAAPREDDAGDGAKRPSAAAKPSPPRRVKRKKKARR